MIDIPNKSFNILSKGFDQKMVPEKLPVLEISGVENAIIKKQCWEQKMQPSINNETIT